MIHHIKIRIRQWFFGLCSGVTALLEFNARAGGPAQTTNLIVRDVHMKVCQSIEKRSIPILNLQEMIFYFKQKENRNVVRNVRLRKYRRSGNHKRKRRQPGAQRLVCGKGRAQRHSFMMHEPREKSTVGDGHGQIKNTLAHVVKSKTRSPMSKAGWVCSGCSRLCDEVAGASATVAGFVDGATGLATEGGLNHGCFQRNCMSRINNSVNSWRTEQGRQT